MIAKLFMIVVFVAIVVAIGVYTRQHARSVDGFVLGGRNVGPWLSAFAYGTSYFSAVIFVGYAGQFGWKFGISAFWIGLGNAFLGSLLAWWVLGPRTREMTQRLKAATMPEFFGKRYDSKALRIACAAIIFVFLIPYTASVYNGLSRLFTMAFGIPYEWCVVGMAVVTCIYVVLGGYMATVVNDFVQGIIMLIGITAVVLAVLNSNGGFSEAVVSLSQVQAEGSSLQGAFTSMFGPDLFNLICVIILTSLGTWGLPQMVQKFYAIKSGPAVKEGAIISTLFAIVVAGGSYFIGGFGRLYSDQIAYAANGTPVYDSIMPTEMLRLKIDPSGSLSPVSVITIESPTPLLRIDTTAIHLYTKVDSLWYDAEYVFKPSPYNIRCYTLTADWKPETEYSLEIDSAAIEDIYGLVIGPVKQGLKVKSEDDYSTLTVNLSGIQDTAIIVQLLSSSEKVVTQVKAKNGTAEFYYVNPGKYYLRAFVDSNGNGQWDTGDYYADRQAEAVYYYPEETECKAKWDVTRNWNLTARRRFEQKPAAIVKQKPDKEKKLKNRNLERAKELGKEYVEKKTGVRL